MSKWYCALEKKYIWKECIVEAYNKEEDRYLIQWRHNGERKYTNRMNMIFEHDNQLRFETRIEVAQKERYKCLYLKEYMKNMIEGQDPKQFYLSLTNVQRILDSVFKKNLQDKSFIIESLTEVLFHYKCYCAKITKEMAYKTMDIDKMQRKLFPEDYLQHKKQESINKNLTKLYKEGWVYSSYVKYSDEA